jgi:hypothetical protein
VMLPSRTGIGPTLPQGRRPGQRRDAPSSDPQTLWKPPPAPRDLPVASARDRRIDVLPRPGGLPDHHPGGDRRPDADRHAARRRALPGALRADRRRVHDRRGRVGGGAPGPSAHRDDADALGQRRCGRRGGHARDLLRRRQSRRHHPPPRLAGTRRACAPDDGAERERRARNGAALPPPAAPLHRSGRARPRGAAAPGRGVHRHAPPHRPRGLDGQPLLGGAAAARGGRRRARHRARLRVGDTAIVYGRAHELEQLADRPSGSRGEEIHRAAIAVHADRVAARKGDRWLVSAR